jgi:hypothetical protein
MTPRTIEIEFAKQLAQQQEDQYPLDLSLEGPVMHQLHPRLIWAKLQFNQNSDSVHTKVPLDGWNYACFTSIEEASSKYPEISLIFEGRPWSFKRFIDQNHSEAIIDFPPLGTVVLSRNNLSAGVVNNLAECLLPIWLTYALSPELWGPQGKWIRFHHRILKLLEQKALLNGESFLGYYQLNERAEHLEKFGFIGTRLEKSYILVLPWTFSLSALNKLEETLRQEF